MDFGLSSSFVMADVFRTVSRTFYDELLKLEPAFSNENHRRILHLIAFPHKTENGEDIAAVADYQTLAKQLGLEHLAEAKRFVGGKYLKAFRADVGGNKDLFETCQINRHNWRTRAAKTIHAPLAAPTKNLLERELMEWRPKAALKDQLDLFSLAIPTTRTRSHEIESLRAWQIFSGEQVDKMPDEAREFLTAMNARPRNLFTRLVRQNFPAAFQEALKLEGFSARTAVLAMLYRIQEQPQPFYRFSRHLRTSRIFPANVSMLTVPGSVRRALTHGCIECDLQNSQLVIVASRWGLPALQEFVATGKSIWQELSVWLDAPFDEKIKAAIKNEFLYPIIFGRSPEWATLAVQKTLKKKKRLWARLVEHPLMAELLAGRDAYCTKIVAEDGLTTILGSRLPLHVPEDPRNMKARLRSILAHDAQETELALMLPILKLEKQTQDFSVVLHQHDGMTIKVNKAGREAQVQARIRMSVENNARSLGLPAVLVWKSACANSVDGKVMP